MNAGSSGFGIKTSGGGGGGSSSNIPITDPAIIANITNSANWDSNNQYIGSTAGLVEGNFYIDLDWNQKYEYFSSVMFRVTFNSLTQ